MLLGRTMLQKIIEQLTLVVASMKAIAEISSLHTSRCPFQDARCRGVLPSWKRKEDQTFMLNLTKVKVHSAINFPGYGDTHPPS